MIRPRPTSMLCARRALAGSFAWCAGVWLLASACGPGVATPMPEPPTVFNLNDVGQPDTMTVDYPNDPDIKAIHVFAGRLPAHTTVRVTNLDRTNDTAAVTLPSDELGAELLIAAVDGDELRFEAVLDGVRSAPADAIFVAESADGRFFHLDPAPRFDCLTLGYALDFATEQASLDLSNGCSTPVALDNPRLRLGVDDFALQTALPLEIPSGESTQLDLTFMRAAGGFREDILFFDVALDGTTRRYPVTLRAE